MFEYVSDVKFLCPVCTDYIKCEVAVPEPDWSEDRARDRMAHDEITLECPNCGGSFEVDVTNSDGNIDMDFSEYDTHTINCSYGYHKGDIDDMDFWSSIPDSPADILKDSLSDALKLLEKHGETTYMPVLIRMVFVHCFGALEAYLADTLINAVRSDNKSLARLLEGDKDLKDKKISLREVMEHQDIVIREAIDHLRSIMYHNLAKVDVLYKITCGFSVFPDDEVRKRLNKNVPVRHDCVHRNGCDKEGNLRAELTKEYVVAVSEVIIILVDDIEQQKPSYGST